MRTRTVLIIDGDLAAAHAMARRLDISARYTTSVESSARAGLATAQRLVPDLILMDTVLPDGTGRDVAASLAGEARTRKVPIAWLSADAPQGTPAERSAALLGKPLITKPIDLTQIVERVDRLLGIRALPRRGAPPDGPRAGA